MINRKGIILAGGKGSRLRPITNAVNKQLLPIYDKPMIFYPLSVLMILGIKEILLICNPSDLKQYQNLLGDGSHLGISIEYSIQDKANGIAESLIIADDFLGGSSSVLILGDNIFYGPTLKNDLEEAYKSRENTICLSYVNNPNSYGVVKFDKDKMVKNIIEKPNKFISNYAVTGLYFYGPDAPEYARKLKPSKRGELEITDLNKLYLKEGRLKYVRLDNGVAWLDTGSVDNLLEASIFIGAIEKRQRLKVCCPEAIAFSNKWITPNDLRKIAQKNYSGTSYFDYLIEIARNGS